MRERRWRHITLREMDALELGFPDDSFDYVTAFHVVSVVPDAGRLMHEAQRVCRPGGKLIIINHGDGFETRYAHNRKLLVRVGDNVASGQTIAQVGRTGNATTDHCHFEIRRNEEPVDPLPYLSGDLER